MTKFTFFSSEVHAINFKIRYCRCYCSKYLWRYGLKTKCGQFLNCQEVQAVGSLHVFHWPVLPLVHFNYFMNSQDRPFAVRDHLLRYHKAMPYWRASILVISDLIGVTAVCIQTKNTDDNQLKGIPLVNIQ